MVISVVEEVSEISFTREGGTKGTSTGLTKAWRVNKVTSPTLIKKRAIRITNG